jgi:hypothetical protein
MEKRKGFDFKTKSGLVINFQHKKKIKETKQKMEKRKGFEK